MNIRDLKYLVAVAKTQHFGKAADLCFVSQPTLSMQLKKLEEELNVQLFERTSKKVLVTEVGKKLVDKARHVLAEIEALKMIAQTAQDPYSGELRLGIIPTIGPYLLPKLMPLLAESYPNLSLVLCEDKTEIIMEKLACGELDAIILALPVDDNVFVTEELMLELFLVAVPKGHRLASKTNLQMSDLKDEELLLLGEGHCFRDQALEACRFSGASARSGFQATSLETLRHMVSANVGITLLPKMMVDTLPADSNMVVIPFADPVPSRRIGLLFRDCSPSTHAAQALAELVRSI